MFSCSKQIEINHTCYECNRTLYSLKKGTKNND